jgi:hypothetical protein
MQIDSQSSLSEWLLLPAVLLLPLLLLPPQPVAHKVVKHPEHHDALSVRDAQF